MIIQGPEGPLEAALSEPPGTQAGKQLCVLCHPHPQYGGSMDDMVLATVTGVLAEAGIASLRFNFRGVGGSGGQYSGDGGEVDDLRAVLVWLTGEYPDTELILGGYSFGASIVAQLLATEPDCAATRILLVAPPLGNLPVPKPVGDMRLDLFVGTQDAFVEQARLDDWPGDAVHRIAVHRIEGADHFFSRRLDALETAISESLHR